MAVEQQVLRLQVAVDDVVRVQIVEGEGDFGGIELGDGVGEALGLAQQTKQLAALDKVHDHVEVLGVLEGAPEGDEEGVLDLLQHAALVVGVLDLLHLDDLGLFEHLDGVEALVVLALDEVDAAEAAGAEGALDGEVGQRVLALCDAGLVEGLRLQLQGAILGGARGGGGGRGAGVGSGGGRRGRRGGGVGVYEVLDRGRVVGGLGGRRGARMRLRRVRGGVHRVGGPGGSGGRRVGEGAFVGPGLVQVERARLARRRRRDGRAAVLDGRRRRVDVLGARRVLGALLLEEAEGRHGRGARNAARNADGS